VRLSRWVVLSGLLLVTAACGYSDPYQGTGGQAIVGVATPTLAPGADDFNAGAGKTPVKYPDGLQVTDIKVGDGATVKKGDAISVQYTGWLTSGSKFDSSRDRGQPFDLTIGAGQVIPGWDEGVPGMKVGGQRKLVIPAALAYGSQAQPSGCSNAPGSQPCTIPANSTLVFLVEVVADNGPAPSPSPSASP
jgi:FKBP-type peptidyl-prolyl cis-trans isomerase FkpA